MSRFVSEQTTKIELEGGDWVEAKSKLSWKAVQDVFSAEGDSTLPMLKVALVKWNLKDKKGKEMDCNSENMDLLDFPTVQFLIGKIMELYLPKKKK